VVRSQISNLTPNPSFSHNLCFKNRNGSCEPILNIYVPRYFQWYKKLLNPMSFDSCNCPLKIQKFIRTPTPKEAHLEVWGFIPSHFLALSGAWNVTPRFTFGPYLCKPLPWLQTQGYGCNTSCVFIFFIFLCNIFIVFYILLSIYAIPSSCRG